MSKPLMSCAIAICFLSLFLVGCGNNSQNETKTAQYFQSIQDNPSELRIFLQAMPKGGDLHNHLDGAVFAENFIDDGLAQHETGYETVENNPDAYANMIDKFSVRDYKVLHEVGDVQFFDTFGNFGSIDKYPQMLVDVLPTLGRQHIDYVEFMLVPNPADAMGLTKNIPFTTDFAKLTDELNQAGMPALVKKDSAMLDEMTTYSQKALKCGTAEASRGCKVTVRYQFTTLRNTPPIDVYSQLLESFEAANQDPRVVGINLLQQENEPISVHDYDLHMQMVHYLHTVYPNVNISLHAGEMVLGQVPPYYLKDHIYKAVNIADANRIGHGVDIASEDHANKLLDEMAKKHILVEINLTSNDVILGVHGKNHPIMLYLDHHVPIALSTDDAGVLRTDLTHEYQRAVETYHLSYSTLKNIDRNSLSYAFIQGASLWKDNDTCEPVEACRWDTMGSATPSESCQKFLASSQKATLQWRLEAQFKRFEAKF